LKKENFKKLKGGDGSEKTAGFSDTDDYQLWVSSKTRS
jgi:hypothetical protein